jgi:hypothetical protein
MASKTSRPMIRIHDVENDEIIDRELNDAEFAQYELDQKNYQAEQAQIAAKVVAKAALLERLGITEDEAKLLLG